MAKVCFKNLHKSIENVIVPKEHLQGGDAVHAACVATTPRPTRALTSCSSPTPWLSLLCSALHSVPTSSFLVSDRIERAPLSHHRPPCA